MKNECAKKRPKDNPYEIWSGPNGFIWKVLKKYQNPEKEAQNPYARWYCFVTSNIYPPGEYGDVYVREIIEQGVRIS